MGFVYDYDVAEGQGGLKRILHEINIHGYQIVAITQSEGEYTVVFQRPLEGKYSRW